MNNSFWQRFRTLWRADFFSAKDFLIRVLLITIAFLVVHLAGLREFTSFLNGTTGSTELGWGISVLLGVIYIFFYLAFVLFVPTLLLAATILVVGRRFCRNNHTRKT